MDYDWWEEVQFKLKGDCMNVYTTIEKEDIRLRIADKKRLAKRDGHEDGYWFSLLDSLYEDLIHSIKYNPVEEVNIGDLATKEYVDSRVEAVLKAQNGK